MKKPISLLITACIAANAIYTPLTPTARADDKKPAAAPLLRANTFDGEIRKHWTADKGKVTVVNISIDTGDASYQELRIRFDTATGAPEMAWWLTKGRLPIVLPKEGLSLKAMPKVGTSMRITIDRDLPPEAEYTPGLQMLAIGPAE